MKGMDIFCASQAATAIRLAMDDQGASSSSISISTIRLGGGGSSGRAIDRYNPIIRDASRIGKMLVTPRAPCSSQQTPISPKPHNHHKNSRKNPTNSKENSNAHPPNHNHQQTKKIISSKQNDEKRKSSIDKKIDDDKKYNYASIKKSSWSCTKPGEFFSPPGSTRYLLSSSTSTQQHHHHPAGQKSISLSDHFDDPLLDQLLPLNVLEPSKTQPPNKKDVDESSSSSSSSAPEPTPSSQSPPQVVVLRVSLHCKGCERKMRKHLSKMEGVTSFDIDFAAKKLTVRGDVTPLAVLASVSKVKNAQLLTLPLSSSTPSVCSNSLGIEKDRGIIV